MKYAVSREGTALVTLHGGSDTTARDEATEQLAATLESLADDAIVDWTIDDAEVHEAPTGPFDPYTIAVAFDVRVVVESEDAEAAERRGATAIDEALADAGVESVSYTSEPVAAAV